MMMATPALSSAPRIVVPLAVMMSSPTFVGEIRQLLGREHRLRVVGQDDVAAVVVAVHDRLDVRSR